MEDNRTVPSIYIIKLLKNASKNELIGELFLNIAISLKDNEWSQIHPQHLGIIFDNLRMANQNQAINELALEILENIN